MTRSEAVEIRIGSYNIRKAMGTDRRRNPYRVLDIINAMQCDVVVLQEADLRLGQRKAVMSEDMIEKHTDLELIRVAPNSISMGWHGIAVLAKPGLKLMAIDRVSLPGLEPRGAVILDCMWAGADLRIIGLHLGLLRNSRRQQISFLTELLSGKGSKPTVLAGDLNERSSSVGLGRLCPTFRIHSPGATFHARHPVLRLDRFATAEGATLVETEVFSEGPAKYASDHLPIWARVALC